MKVTKRSINRISNSDALAIVKSQGLLAINFDTTTAEINSAARKFLRRMKSDFEMEIRNGEVFAESKFA